jgi:hypothetical protein
MPVTDRRPLRADRVVPIADQPLLVYPDQQTYSEIVRTEKRAAGGGAYLREPGLRSPFSRAPLKFVEQRKFTNPDAAARRLVEIANAIEPSQEGRIYIEIINDRFPRDGATPDQFRAGLERSIARGWLSLHESGTYVKFTSAGAELCA